MAKYLSSPTEPIKARPRSIGELLDAMRDTAFQGRKLGEALETWVKMLGERRLTVFLGLSGAMVPAGMGRIIAHLIRRRYIDCLVSTGANVFHDLHEALGGRHYKGSPWVDDARLRSLGIDRMYDVYAAEKDFRKVDEFIAGVAGKLEQERAYSSREIVCYLGEEAARRGAREDSIVVSAYREELPVFVPALADSSVGIGLMLARRRGCGVILDQMKDLEEITQVVEKAGKTGVIYVGGGVPKNFVQQTEVVLSHLGLKRRGHSYGVQFTTDAPHFGGLSGCTFEEAVSWGKVSSTAKKVQVFVDATIALPLVVHALGEKVKGLRRRVPGYSWAKEGLKIGFKEVVL